MFLVDLQRKGNFMETTQKGVKEAINMKSTY